MGVLLLGGDRVSVYCVEGHRFNLIMPEGPCATPTKPYTHATHSSYSSSAALKNSGGANNIVHPRQNRLSVAVHKGLTLISGVNIDCGGQHCNALFVIAILGSVCTDTPSATCVPDLIRLRFRSIISSRRKCKML